jgi:hypothetical protein
MMAAPVVAAGVVARVGLVTAVAREAGGTVTRGTTGVRAA